MTLASSEARRKHQIGAFHWRPLPGPRPHLQLRQRRKFDDAVGHDFALLDELIHRRLWQDRHIGGFTALDSFHNLAGRGITYRDLVSRFAFELAD
jgi:hypothetical protein